MNTWTFAFDTNLELFYLIDLSVDNFRIRVIINHNTCLEHLMLTLSNLLRDQISQLNIPIVDSHYPVSNPTEFIDYARGLKNLEGFVIAWDNGYRVKIKAEEYIKFHKAKDGLSFEKNVIDLLVNDKLDDVKSFMMDEDRIQIEQFENQFWQKFEVCVQVTNIQLKTAVEHFGGDRRRFAIEHANMLVPTVRSVIFACWDGKKEVRSELLNIIRKNTGSQSRIDSVRFIWGKLKWEYNSNLEM